MATISAHAKQRARERFDVDLDNEFLRDLTIRIMRFLNNGCAPTRTLIELESKTHSDDRIVIAFKVSETWLPGVFDRSSGQIVTVLPKDKLPLELREGVHAR